MKNIYASSYEEIATLAYSLGLSMAEQLTVNEQGILGNFYVTLGQVILIANSVGRSYPPFSTSPFEGGFGIGSAFSQSRYGNNNASKNTTIEDPINMIQLENRINDLQNQIVLLQMELDKIRSK